MISQKDFIEASRKFVCVRLETYESKETQDHIRKLLDGTMQNTAFTIYAPDGKTQLTGSGRAPEHVFHRFVKGGRSRGGAQRFGGASNETVIEGMEKIAAKYQPTGSPKEAVLQDFDSFKQSLNIASSDQRVLVFTVASKTKLAAAQNTLQKVASAPEIVGRFHFDSAGKEDVKWHTQIKGETQKSGIFLIRSGEFGQTGTVLEQLPIDISVRDLKDAMLAANKQFKRAETRKNYGDHVHEGRKQGIHFENNIQQGEDRDGDGEIDTKGKGGRRGEKGRRGMRRGGDDDARPPRRGPRGEGRPPKKGGNHGPPPHHGDEDIFDFLGL